MIIYTHDYTLIHGWLQSLLQVEHFLGDPDVLHAIALILGSELSFLPIQVLACAIGTSKKTKSIEFRSV